MDAETFARHLRVLRTNAGKPTYRDLATRTRYSKTVIGEAFQGRRLPTWQVAEALVRALNANVDESRRRWAVAGGGSADDSAIPSWLTVIRTRVPDLITGRGLPAAVQLAVTTPAAAIDDGWEVVRLSAVQLAGSLYSDMPGNWSSNLVASYHRAESDGHLPSGVGTVAAELQNVRVHMRLPPFPVPTLETAVQYVTLAYRLAYLVNVVLHGEPADPPVDPPPTDDMPPSPPTFAAGEPEPPRD